MASIRHRLTPDKFGESTINNIYFDTPDFRLIRASIEKPTVYKEKLRLRCYGSVTDSTPAFVELKKKYKGIVYKRRIDMPYGEAMAYLTGKASPCKQTQITKEIDFFLGFYKSLQPALCLFYDRRAFYSCEDPDLRITFDTNIRFRTHDKDLSLGSHGEALLDSDSVLMEIKSPRAMPLWLTGELNRLGIFPASYSKYGNSYKLMLNDNKKRLNPSFHI